MRPLASLALIATGLAAAPAALAQGFMSQDFIPGGEERFTLGLGGVVNEFDTRLRLDGARQGTDIDVDLAVPERVNSLEASFTWRIAPRHRLDFNYYSANRSGSRRYEGEIVIDDVVYPVGAEISLDTRNRILDSTYRYSFFKEPSMEIAAVLGVYGGRFEWDILAVGRVAGGSGTVERTYQRTVSTTLPLPLVGLSADWYPDRRVKIGGLVEGLKANIGDVDGYAYVARAYGEYQLVRNFSIGARYQYAKVKADADKSNFDGEVNWRVSAVSLYGKFVW